MRRRVWVGFALSGLLGAWACGQSAGTADAVSADTLTRRQKDSIVSTIPLPGASGIGAAQRAVDRANERVQQHDTVR
jgi:hypothetical protein